MKFHNGGEDGRGVDWGVPFAAGAFGFAAAPAFEPVAGAAEREGAGGRDVKSFVLLYAAEVSASAPSGTAGSNHVGRVTME